MEALSSGFVRREGFVELKEQENMAIWKCDKCGTEFEDFTDHQGDSCNQCDDDGGDSGTIYEYTDGDRFIDEPIDLI